MELYIPWRIRLAAYRVYQQVRSVLSYGLAKKHSGMRVSFYCNYHQTTGATVAIASIANHLADRYSVDAYIRPQSGYSRLLSLKVAQTFSPEKLRGDLVIVDIEQESAVLEALLAQGREVMITCHALPTELHAVPQPKLIRNLELATYVHFVSDFQRDAFLGHYPGLSLESKSVFVPNYTRKSFKNSSTRSVGVVGYLSRPAKNGLKAIELAQQSNARSIECWGSDEIAGVDNLAAYPKLKVNGWSDSTRAMHSTFDVLISASLHETFGLVVSEALSAGIPCLLSDIPVFRSLYGKCPGVRLMTGDEHRDVATLNYLLEHAGELKPEIIAFWNRHFSDETVRAGWFSWIELIASKRRAGRPLV